MADATCADRFFATYAVGKNEWHVVSLDAPTGVHQWDVVLEEKMTRDALNAVPCSTRRTGAS